MLSFDGIYKRFGDKEVLRGLDMHVPANSVFGFIGKNGAGKTTAMKAALGLLKVDAGDIRVGGEKVRYGNAQTNRMIGYLPDVPEFYPFMTAREYLALCADITGVDKNEVKSRCDELLELVGLGGEKHRIGGFSRGMKQRLGIAQALFSRPKLLICDEPTSALDPVGRKEILDILLAASAQTTVLFSTHILSDVERICTDIALLNEGKAELNGKLSEIREKRGSDEYLLECAPDCRAALLCRFAFMKEEGDSLAFKDDGKHIYEVLRFVSDNELGVYKMERKEPSLEALFMEAMKK